MKFCDCEHDGYCQRYQRVMNGRFRQLCDGINVDLGTAAAFREQWYREAGEAKPSTDPPFHLVLKTNQAPGDAVAMTAAIYSLHRAYPGRFLTSVESPWPEIFAHNPNVTPRTEADAELHMHYPAIHKANERGIHFMQGWCEFIGMALGINVPLLTNRPRLYFADPAPPEGDFWVVCSGGKRDFTNKLWGHHNYQQVVNDLRGKINFVQVGDASHNHTILSGVENMVGKTTLRELFKLVRRSSGVLCGVSLLMHVAAALEKPAIIIAGGREPVQWNAYPKQRYLHTIGLLPCCESGGCWRSRVLPLGDGTNLDENTCARPIDGLPECMRMITPRMVVELAEAIAAF